MPERQDSESGNVPAWEKGGKAVCAVKFKKKLENRSDTACYLRRIGTDKYQVWLPASNKVTTVRVTDFILQRGKPNTPEEICSDEYGI